MIVTVLIKIIIIIITTKYYYYLLVLKRLVYISTIDTRALMLKFVNNDDGNSQC